MIDTTAPLYPCLLAAAWSQLAEPVRAFHDEASLKARGRMRLINGRSGLARAVIWLLRLPTASESADVRLEVERDRGGERWNRTFNGVRVTTWQYATAAGELAEQFRSVEIHFRLASENGALRYTQVRASMRLGPLRLRMPTALAPAVEAHERSRGPGCIDVRVSVSWPPAGLILAYDGAVHFGDGLP